MLIGISLAGHLSHLAQPSPLSPPCMCEHACVHHRQPQHAPAPARLRASAEVSHPASPPLTLAGAGPCLGPGLAVREAGRAALVNRLLPVPGVVAAVL